MQSKLDSILRRLANRKIKFAIYTVGFMAIGFVLPWWSIILVAGFIGWYEEGLMKSAIAALMSCFVAWLLLTLTFDILNGFRISTRLGGLVSMPIPVIANLASAAIGGIVAALSAATVNQLRIVLRLVRSSRKGAYILRK